AGEEAAAIARGCDFRAAAAAARMLASDQTRAGAYARAAELLQRSLALSEAGGDRVQAGVTLGLLALNATRQEQTEAAQQYLTRMAEKAEGEPAQMALVYNSRATVATSIGDRNGQQQALTQALELAEKAGTRHLAARLRSNLADSYMHTEQPERAVKVAQPALEVALKYQDRMLERLLRHNIAVSLLRLKRVDAARRELALINALPVGQSDPRRQIGELRELGEAMAEAGLAREAVGLFHQERNLTAAVQAREREASLEALRVKYDATRKQRDIDLLMRDRRIKDQELSNSRLTELVSIAAALLLTLALVLGAIMLRRVQLANRKLKANQALLRAQSERDPLTDLANRRHFHAVMGQQAAEHLDGALLMIDIDHFKQINDVHGHAAGDVAICEIARRISRAVRQKDLVVRWGGEEFLVFAPGAAEAQLHALAERILHAAGSTPVQTENAQLNVTVSIGYASFPLPPVHLAMAWEPAINWADMALYTAKSQGRNRAIGIQSVNARNAAELALLEADFDAACSSGRVSLRQALGPSR
ncbi:MAG TPA: GGDEF domain-containing protein, partial [Burkholderiaceae bacterium]